MHHLVAFHQSIDPAGVLTPITPVADTVVETRDNDLFVPNALPYVIGGASLLEATAPVAAQIESPTLDRVANIDLAPLGTGLVFSDLPAVNMHPHNALPLSPFESINFLINSNPAGATSQYGLVWLADGPQPQVSGEIMTIRATASITNVLGAWSAGQLTFDQKLPIGDFDVVGMRVVESTSVAARLVFKEATWRPGVAVANSVSEPDMRFMREGHCGTWGTFNTRLIPNLELLGAAGAVTPVVYLDVVHRG